MLASEKISEFRPNFAHKQAAPPRHARRETILHLLLALNITSMSRGRRGPPQTDHLVSLKIDNLSYRTSIDDLRYKFEKYGEVADVHIPKDR